MIDNMGREAPTKTRREATGRPALQFHDRDRQYGGKAMKQVDDACDLPV